MGKDFKRVLHPWVRTFCFICWKKTGRFSRFFEDQATDNSITDSEKKFCVELFFPTIDIIILKLGRTLQRPAFRCQNFQIFCLQNIYWKWHRTKFIKQPNISLKSVNLICVPNLYKQKITAKILVTKFCLTEYVFWKTSSK